MIPGYFAIINLQQASVVLIDEVDNDFYHCILFFCVAFGYHKCKSYEGIVSDTLGAVFIVEDAVTVEKPQEQCSRNAFVAVT